MVRALWTGASGMIAHQTNVDVIANNLANVNTVGYKKEATEFKSLLYQKLQTKTVDNNGDPKPVIGQVGSGVKASTVTSHFTQGNLQSTGNQFDLAIDGTGFFQIQTPDGSIGYTRNGNFTVSMANNDEIALCTSDGCMLLDVNSEPIVFDKSYNIADISIDSDGNVIYTATKQTTDEFGNTHPQSVFENLGKIGLVQFGNPGGLQKVSGTVYKEHASSGEAMLEDDNDNLQKSSIMAGYLEASNVQTVDEMVNLIVAQRAYEMNSKTITAADEMMQQANNLRS